MMVLRRIGSLRTRAIKPEGSLLKLPLPWDANDCMYDYLRYGCFGSLRSSFHPGIDLLEIFGL